MPNEKSLENLKKGRRFKRDDDATKEAARNAAKSKSRNVSIRKQGIKMLNAVPNVGEATLKQLKQLGMEVDDPTLQTLILARIGAMAIGKDSRLALQAAQMLLEITGNDVKSVNAAKDRKIQKVRLEIERERLERDNPSSGEETCARIIVAADGGIEVDDGE